MEYRQPLSRIYLYDEPDAPGLDVEAIGGFLVSTFPQTEVIPRTDFFTHQFGRFPPAERNLLEQETLRQLSAARVHDFASHDDPLGAETISPEEIGLEFVFDATLHQSILRLLIDAQESAADQLHIVFTENGIGTWPGDGGDFKLHILCMGTPSILSVPGLVEALPRPREYDFKRAQLAMFGLQEDALDELADEFADRSFGYGDPRINEICKGYSATDTVRSSLRWTGASPSRVGLPLPRCHISPQNR